jgi:hypothetical protein
MAIVSFHFTSPKKTAVAGSVKTVFYLKPLEIFFTLMVIIARKKY